MRHIKKIWIFITIYPYMLHAGDVTKLRTSPGTLASDDAVEQTATISLKRLLAQLNKKETVIRQFAQETLADKERRNLLSTISAQLAQNDTKDPRKLKQLGRTLSRLIKKQDARVEQVDTDRELEAEALGFTQESFKIMIEQVQEHEESMASLLEGEFPKQKERQQFWQETTELLNDQQLEDEKLIELIEKTTEHLELLAHSLTICAKSFPAKMDCLKVPQRRKSKPGC